MTCAQEQGCNIRYYLWYEEYGEDDSGEDVNKSTKHSSIGIQVVAQQHSTNYHDGDDDRSDVDDESNVLCIVEGLDFDLSRPDGQEHRDQLCYEDVSIEDYYPDQVIRALADEVVTVQENIVFLQVI